MNWSITKRPTSWDDVWGCDNFKKAVRAWTKKNDPPVGVILSGVYGSGKSTTAKIYAATLACKDPKPNGDPCGVCETCKAVFEERFNRDVIMINGGTANKETLVDELTDFVSFPARKDRVKVAIIEEVQELHDKARNAMLKWLETMHAGFHFIMLTMKDTEKSGFASRSQVFRFRPLDVESLAKFLWRFCKKYDVPVSEDKLESLFAIAESANGSIREAIQNLERCYDTETWDPLEIRRELGVVDQVGQLEVLQALLDGKVNDKLFEKMTMERDFDRVFKFNMNAIASADALNTFGVSGAAAFVKDDEYDRMNDREKKAWEAFAAKKAFAMKASVELLAKHPNFEVVRDGFLAIESSYDTYSEDLKKARYVLLTCELARKIGQKRPVRKAAKSDKDAVQ
jgi:DNA polymerase III delta prime subunit